MIILAKRFNGERVVIQFRDHGKSAKGWRSTFAFDGHLVESIWPTEGDQYNASQRLRHDQAVLAEHGIDLSQNYEVRDDDEVN